MILRNHTHWRTADLRAFISRLAKDELSDRPQALKLLTVHVKYTRPGPRPHYKPGDEVEPSWKHGGYSSGCAYIGGFEMTVRLPRHHIPDKIDFAMVIAHELAHIRGMRHAAMRNMPRYHRVGNWREFYAWAADLLLERETPKAKPDRSMRSQAKEQHARALLQKWERRVKLSKTKLQLWKRKVRYYDRKNALSLAAKKPTT